MSEDCAICYEPLEQELYTLNCQHQYHRDCITRWLHTKPTCPLCRAPVDADTRYVDDNIMTEESRQYLESLKSLWLMTAQGLEWFFPHALHGYTEKATELLESDHIKALLENAAERRTGEDNSLADLMTSFGSAGIEQFIANGGLRRWISNEETNTDD